MADKKGFGLNGKLGKVTAVAGIASEAEGTVKECDVAGTVVGDNITAKNMGKAEVAQDDFVIFGTDYKGQAFFFGTEES